MDTLKINSSEKITKNDEIQHALSTIDILIDKIDIINNRDLLSQYVDCVNKITTKCEIILNQIELDIKSELIQSPKQEIFTCFDKNFYCADTDTTFIFENIIDEFNYEFDNKTTAINNDESDVMIKPNKKRKYTKKNKTVFLNN